MIEKIKAVLSLAEEWCADQENGLTEGEVCISALKDIRRIIQQSKEFNLGDTVKVQVFNYVIKGEVIKKSTYETKLGVDSQYRIKFGESYDQTIDMWEDTLISTQSLPLGKIL